MVAKADRGRVIKAIDLLCDTPAAGSALKDELEAMAAQRTGGPGGEHWSSPRGLSLALHHPAARCSWNTGLFRSAAELDRGAGMNRGSLDQTKQQHCTTFRLSCGTNSRHALGPTQLDAPMASCCGARKESALGTQATIHADRRGLCSLGAADATPGPGRRSGSRYGKK